MPESFLHFFLSFAEVNMIYSNCKVLHLLHINFRPPQVSSEAWSTDALSYLSPSLRASASQSPGAGQPMAKELFAYQPPVPRPELPPLSTRVPPRQPPPGIMPTSQPEAQGQEADSSILDPDLYLSLLPSPRANWYPLIPTPPCPAPASN